MTNELALLVLGWLLGLVSSLVASLVMFWLEGRRTIRLEAVKQRQEDIRIARNWTSEGKKVSLRGFDLARANLSGKDLAGADLEDANFEGAQMWGTNLSGANLRRANFHRAKLVGVNLEGANLLLADFTGAMIGESNFAEAQLRRTKLHKAKKVVDCVWNGAKVDETTELSVELREEIERQSVPTGELESRDETSSG